MGVFEYSLLVRVVMFVISVLKRIVSVLAGEMIYNSSYVSTSGGPGHVLTG